VTTRPRSPASWRRGLFFVRRFRHFPCLIYRLVLPAIFLVGPDLYSLNNHENEYESVMAKAPVVEENDLRRLLKVTGVSGECPIRNIALVYVLYGTGLMLTEVASITTWDYLTEKGLVRDKSEVRAEIAYNSKSRALYWSNPKVTNAIDSYLAERVRLGHGLTARKAAFRGLDPDTPLFRRGDGQPYQLIQRKTSTGALSYSCDSLSQLYRKLHAQAGILGATALSGRRTFAVRLYRKGFDLKHICELLGHSSISSTKALCDSDPIKLGTLVAGII